MLLKSIHNYCLSCVDRFDTIASSRKILLLELAEHIKSNTSDKIPLDLVFICTHNSRRSQFGQVWATIAAQYFNIPIKTYSAGTETTSFHPNAVQALVDAGVEVERITNEPNSQLKLTYGNDLHQIYFSKKIDHQTLPQKDFLAIMTCSDAAENCPFIPNAKWRFPLTYEDPKKFDGTPQENEKYAERCRQIATELLFVFYSVDNAF